MNRAATTVLLLGACLAAVAPPRAVAQLTLLVPALPSPTDVVKLIDTLTKKDSSTGVDVKLGQTVGQGKLLIATTRMDVHLDRSSRNWRGRVEVRMTIPSEVAYTIDLADIRPEHIRCDHARRVLLVAMPTPRVASVTPDLAAARTERTFKRARFRRLDADVARELQNTILTGDYQARARATAEARLAQIKKSGREPLQAFFEALLSRTLPGTRVIVE
jgi:hypothetical protein